MMTWVIHLDILRFTSKSKLIKQARSLRGGKLEQTAEKTKK